MKLIIAGGRNVANAVDIIKSYMLSNKGDIDPTEISEVVSGMAKGADTGGELWAEEAGITIKQFPANWNKYGRGAGPMRNKQMAEYGDILLLIWTGKSKGSANMKANMEKLGKPVYEIIV